MTCLYTLRGFFYEGNNGWRRTEASVKPVLPVVLSVEDAFDFMYSLPITTLVSGTYRVQESPKDAAIAHQTWNWNQAERQKRIEAAPIAGPNLEFHKI